VQSLSAIRINSFKPLINFDAFNYNPFGPIVPALPSFASLSLSHTYTHTYTHTHTYIHTYKHTFASPLCLSVYVSRFTSPPLPLSFPLFQSKAESKRSKLINCLTLKDLIDEIT